MHFVDLVCRIAWRSPSRTIWPTNVTTTLRLKKAQESHDNRRCHAWWAEVKKALYAWLTPSLRLGTLMAAADLGQQYEALIVSEFMVCISKGG
jgi:hypothetical protein